MIAKRDRPTKQPSFDVDEYVRQVDARIAALGLSEEELKAIHRRAAEQVTQVELDEADEIARRFFEGQKKNRGIPRSADARRRRPA